MRKKSRPAGFLPAGEVPAPLALGPCIEVWQDDERASSGHTSATRNYSLARRAWLRGHGMTTAELSPSRPPFSIGYLIETGRTDHASQRLATVGATVEDLPALRDEASALVAACSPARAAV